MKLKHGLGTLYSISPDQETKEAYSTASKAHTRLNGRLNYSSNTVIMAVWLHTSLTAALKPSPTAQTIHTLTNLFHHQELSLA